MHEPPQFNRDHGSRVRLQHEGLDCAFFAACNVIGAMVGREADCTLPEARQLRALARDLLWSGGNSQDSLASAHAEGEETLRLWCKAYGERRTPALPEPAASPIQRHQESQGCAPSRKRNRRPSARFAQPQPSARTAQTTMLHWLHPTAVKSPGADTAKDAETRSQTQSGDRAPAPNELGTRRDTASSEGEIEPAALSTPLPPYQARSPSPLTQAQAEGRAQAPHELGTRRMSETHETENGPAEPAVPLPPPPYAPQQERRSPTAVNQPAWTHAGYSPSQWARARDWLDAQQGAQAKIWTATGTVAAGHLRQLLSGEVVEREKARRTPGQNWDCTSRRTKC